LATGLVHALEPCRNIINKANKLIEAIIQVWYTVNQNKLPKKWKNPLNVRYSYEIRKATVLCALFEVSLRHFGINYNIGKWF